MMARRPSLLHCGGRKRRRAEVAPCFRPAASYDDRRLFAMLILEGAQAGLIWITILRKRKNYYAFMQAVGMANDHVVDCFRYPQVKALAA